MPVSTWQEEGRKSCVCQYFFSCHKHSSTILCWKKNQYRHFSQTVTLGKATAFPVMWNTIHKLRQQRQVKAFFFKPRHTAISSPYPYYHQLTTDHQAGLLLRSVSSGSHFRYATCPGVTACSNQQPDTQLWNTPQEQQINLTSSLKHYSQNIRFKMLILISTAFKAQGQKLTEKNVLFMPQIWY